MKRIAAIAAVVALLLSGCDALPSSSGTTIVKGQSTRVTCV